MNTAVKDVQSADFEFSALSEAKNYRNALLREFSSYLRGHVLEIGAGIGQITESLLENPAIEKLASVEPELKFCAQLRAAFPDHHVIHGTVDNVNGNESWNAIVSINVLEHIADDERELSLYCHKLSEKKGALCLFVPARPEIYASLDKDFGHFRRYTKPDLLRKLRQAGFSIERARYYNFAGYFAWWLSFCVIKKRDFDIRAVRLFDSFIFPLVYAFESRIFPPPFGQSLLVVARPNR